MKRHVDLAALLYMLWGAINLLLSLSLVSIGVAAALLGAEGAGEGDAPVAAGIVAAAFFGLAILDSVFGTLHLFVGSRLRRGREWARALAIVLALVNLVLVPFGTALGAYALWALLHHRSRPLFEAPPRASVSTAR